MRPFIVWNKLHCEYGSCSWAVVPDNILTVVTASGTKSTQLGQLDPEGLARMLMREMRVDELDVA